MPVELRDDLQLMLGDGCRIERELGGGGMSRVFLAHDLTLGRRIVIKVLAPELAEGMSADRFKREIQLAAGLQHPHIVPVLTAVSAGTLLYYTMPFVAGETLGARLSRDGAMSTADAVPILRDAIRALAYAHRHQVVHRDIKPDNILLSEDSALVADFGIAKALSDAAANQQRLTSVGLSVGTPAYMAPEQSVGDPSIDHRADIYSLGAVAYEMLGGRHPFAGKSARQMMAAHVLEVPPPLSQIAPAVPESLATLVMQCLEKDPSNRPQTADALLHALDASLTPVSGTASATPRGPHIWKIGAALAVVALLVSAGAIFAFAPPDKLATAMALIRRAPATLHSNRVIVTPFANETGDPKLASLGSMSADWIAQGLTRAGGLEVVDARTTLATGKVVDNIPWPLKSRNRGKAMAEETGAGILISGTMYREGDSLRVHTKMTDVSTGRVVLVLSPVSGPVDAPTRVLDALSNRIVANIVQARLPERRVTLGEYSEVPSLDAYEETIKGVEAYFRGDTVGYAHFARAIAIDSTYATPVVFLAFSRLYRGDAEIAAKWLQRAATLRNKMAPADKAMLEHLDAMLRGDPRAALATSETFLLATPGSVESPLLVASTALATGYPARALAVLQHTDPDRGLNLGGAFFWFYKAGALNALGRHAEALKVCIEGSRRFPQNSSLFTERALALIGLRKFDALEELSRDGPPAGGSQVVGNARRAHRIVAFLRAFGHDTVAMRLGGASLDRLRAAQETTTVARAVEGDLLFALNRWQEARPILTQLSLRARNSFGRRHFTGLAAVAAAQMGLHDEARRMDSVLVRDTARYDNGFVELVRAGIAAHLGERERAVALLRRAEASGARLTIPINLFRFQSALQVLRGYPPYEELLRPRG